MKFSSYLNTDYIFPNLEANSKEEIIRKIVNKVAEDDRAVGEQKEEIIKNIIKREEEISTCIGGGIFLPHTRMIDFSDFIIAVATVKDKIVSDIGGTNQKDEIKVVFLIVSDVLKNKNLLKAMSVISKIGLKQPEVIEKIKKSNSPKEIYELLAANDIELEHKIIAEDVLSPEIRPARENDTLEEIAKRLILEQKSALPVLSDDNVLLGEITERELIGFGMPEHLSLMSDLNFLTVGEPFEEYLLNESTMTIKDIYRKDIKHLMIDKDTPIMEICFKMVYKGMHRLYVVNPKNNKYLGIINRSDIIKKVLHI
ncbi:PTS sugar transporter subunit IIA [Fusobacterium pseudoperiodonticum]|uniref:PTS sugar transporter subunit IIA n=1 Tax=Fusobacterium periodonticum TaxID=860 RepID=UPI00195CF2DE|nr:PTS sugar transporter subunit IIA [Fusobacterium periodonticum]VTX60137.1 Phosphoenolpyruvate-dependent sugar phosphotransferase system, EIIA 2 [Fusobacterium periodonticum]